MNKDKIILCYVIVLSRVQPVQWVPQVLEERMVFPVQKVQSLCTIIYDK
jgi:hypothetical protein